MNIPRISQRNEAIFICKVHQLRKIKHLTEPNCRHWQTSEGGIHVEFYRIKYSLKCELNSVQPHHWIKKKMNSEDPINPTT